MALVARSLSEPSTTGRILKSRAYLQDSLARKAEIKLQEDSKAAVRHMMETGSQDFDMAARFVPPILETVVKKEQTVSFYGGSKPRLSVTYKRKTYRTFAKK